MIRVAHRARNPNIVQTVPSGGVCGWICARASRACGQAVPTCWPVQCGAAPAVRRQARPRRRAGGGGRAGRRAHELGRLHDQPAFADALYFGASRLYRSDDRGDHWMAGPPHVTLMRGLSHHGEGVGPGHDRGLQQRHDRAQHHCVARRVAAGEGLIYAGSDDGVLS